MSKVGIVVDNSCGISPEEAKSLGVEVIYITFLIDGNEYCEDKNLTREEFFAKLDTCNSLSTSQPSQELVKECWSKLLTKYDEVVFLPISSGLSSTYQSSVFSSLEFNGKVQIVNNKRVSVTLKMAIYQALQMANEGKSALEIKNYLENESLKSSIYITVPTLKYLKKGGRITPAAAAIGSLLSIKPVLQIQGDKLDSFAKVLTIKQAKTKMISAIKKDIETRFNNLEPNKKVVISLAHSCLDLTDFEIFKREVEAEFADYKVALYDALPLCISCHIGLGAIAIACTVVDVNTINNYLK